MWGVFCACSWTWCIGMFLPVIMVNRYGWPGWVVFAVPNVLGCAAFGYVLKTKQRSISLIRAHRPMMIGFSVATVGFHILFATMLAHMADDAWLSDTPLPGLAFAVILFAAALAVSFLNERAWLIAAGLVYLLSLSCFATVDFSVWDSIHDRGDWSLSSLHWLIPVVSLGFLLCPYLDLTFHRALQHAPSRHAFFVFGAAFLVMIILTVLIWFDRKALRSLAFAHIVAQMIFTMGAHLREIRLATARQESTTRRMILSAPLLAVLILPAMQWVLMINDPAEPAYLRYMVFYGLVFPLYALIFIGPARAVGVTRKHILIAGAICLLMTPLYEAGFLLEKLDFAGFTLDPASLALAVPAAGAILWLIARGAYILKK
jgi:hypothetical protein